MQEAIIPIVALQSSEKYERMGRVVGRGFVDCWRRRYGERRQSGSTAAFNNETRTGIAGPFAINDCRGTRCQIEAKEHVIVTESAVQAWETNVACCGFAGKRM